MPLISCVDLPQLHKVLRYSTIIVAAPRSCSSDAVAGGERQAELELTNGSVGDHRRACWPAHMPEGLACLLACLTNHARFGHCRGRSVCPSPLGCDVSASQSWHL